MYMALVMKTLMVILKRYVVMLVNYIVSINTDLLMYINVDNGRCHIIKTWGDILPAAESDLGYFELISKNFHKGNTECNPRVNEGMC